MKLTNRMGLPEPLVNAVLRDGYSRGDADISVTGLLSPPKKTALEALHAAELEEDAADRIWSLMGQVCHSILERSTTVGVAERRLNIVVEGWKVSGGMDYFLSEEGLLQDYKVTTVWKFKDGGVPIEFEQQLNCYAQILREHGIAVKRLQIVGILRDWSKMDAQRDPNFPQAQVIIRDVKLWPEAQAKAFIRERVLLHQAARKELPHCSSMERWAKPDQFAVMKPGAKRAVKLYTSETDATEHAAKEKGLTVIPRPGESTRCKSYCSVAKFCDQAKLMESA